MRPPKKLFHQVEVVHEDDHLIVIEKASGVMSYPAGDQRENSAIQLIRRYWRAQKRQERFLYLIHRLDKETSGLMVFAKSTRARESLRVQFEKHDVVRSYLAVTSGVPRKDAGEIRTNLGRDARGRRSVTDRGKFAVSYYSIVASNRRKNRALIRCSLRTGRTHQVRIHLAYIGAPILGDRVYGKSPGPRLALHAALLGFIHPLTRLPLVFYSSLPNELKRLLSFV